MTSLPSLFMSKDEAIPETFYKFSVINTSVDGCQAEVDKPLYLEFDESDGNNNYSFSNLLIIQPNDENKSLARFYNYYLFTKPLIEILEQSNSDQFYRLRLSATNQPYINKFKLKVDVYITKELLTNLYDNTIPTPQIIVGLIKQENSDKQTITNKIISEIPTQLTTYAETRPVNYDYKIPPHPYQVSNIHWMNDREISVDNNFKYETFQLQYNDDYFKVESMDVGLILRDGNNLVRPEELDQINIIPKGGVLADEVGLGKTLSCIGLISEGLVRSNKTTLVLCPRRLCKQWQEEIHKFTNLKSTIIPSIVQFRKLTISVIDKLDIAIISYNFLLNTKYHNYRLEHLDDPTTFILDKYPWRRVILDEGHEINLKRDAVNSGLFNEICHLTSDYRWIVSGTPFPDARRGSVLRHYLYYESADWSQRYKFRHIYPKLNSELYRKNTKNTLRDQITIPEPSINTEFLDMTEVERIIYQSALGDKNKQIQLCNHIKVSEHHLNILGNEPLTLTQIHTKMTSYYQGRVKWCQARIKNITKQLTDLNLPEPDTQVGVDILLGGTNNMSAPETESDDDGLFNESDDGGVFDDDQINSLESVPESNGTGETDEANNSCHNNELGESYEGSDSDQTNNSDQTNEPDDLEESTDSNSSEPAHEPNGTGESDEVNNSDQLNDPNHNPGNIVELQGKLSNITSDLYSHQARLKIFQQINQKIEETDSCPICLEDFQTQTKVITKCGHFVCASCVHGIFMGNKREAPCHICRYKLQKTDLEVIKNDISEIGDSEVDKWGTKMARLIQHLHSVLSNSHHRVIVFSQWNNMLKLVGKVLSESSISHLFLHGSIHVVNSRIRKFKLDPSVRVVLLSSDRAASGLNLTEATHIVLLDTLNTDRDTAKVIEEQAIGRAVRLGQQRTVQVQRFIMRDTIEHDYYLRNIGHEIGIS